MLFEKRITRCTQAQSLSSVWKIILSSTIVLFLYSKHQKILPSTNSLRPMNGCGDSWGGVVIVWACGVISGPVLKEHGHGSPPKGSVGPCHELGWGDL